MSKLTIRILPVLAVLLLISVKQANAQGVSAYFGLGSAFDSSATQGGCPSGQVPDPIGINQNPGTCTPVNGIGGVFGVFGADFMIKPHFGINGEYAFRFAQSNYMPSEGLNVRPAFYDFNAVYQPSSGDKRIVPVLEAGIGGAKLSLYLSQGQGSVFSSNSLIDTSNHFQLHAAAGVKIYVKSDIFIKPQFDYHWVDNLTDQYGRTSVPEFTISIGYTFGRS